MFSMFQLSGDIKGGSSEIMYLSMGSVNWGYIGCCGKLCMSWVVLGGVRLAFQDS